MGRQIMSGGSRGWGHFFLLFLVFLTSPAFSKGRSTQLFFHQCSAIWGTCDACALGMWAVSFKTFEHHLSQLSVFCPWGRWCEGLALGGGWWMCSYLWALVGMGAVRTAMWFIHPEHFSWEQSGNEGCTLCLPYLLGIHNAFPLSCL